MCLHEPIKCGHNHGHAQIHDQLCAEHIAQTKVRKDRSAEDCLVKLSGQFNSDLQ